MHSEDLNAVPQFFTMRTFTLNLVCLHNCRVSLQSAFVISEKYILCFNFAPSSAVEIKYDRYKTDDFEVRNRIRKIRTKDFIAGNKKQTVARKKIGRTNPKVLLHFKCQFYNPLQFVAGMLLYVSGFGKFNP